MCTYTVRVLIGVLRVYLRFWRLFTVVVVNSESRKRVCTHVLIIFYGRAATGVTVVESVAVCAFAIEKGQRITTPKNPLRLLYGLLLANSNYLAIH